MQLYNLDSNYEKIMLQDDPTHLDDLYKSETNEFDRNRAINVARSIKNNEADAKIIEDEIKLLKKRLQVKEKKIESLKNYLVYMLQSHQIDKVKTPLFDITLRKNQPSLKVTNSELIPDQYWVTKTTKSRNDAAIKIHLKSNVDVPGCNLETSYSIRINTYQGSVEEAEKSE